MPTSGLLLLCLRESYCYLITSIPTYYHICHPCKVPCGDSEQALFYMVIIAIHTHPLQINATPVYYMYTSKINSKNMLDTEPKTIEEMMDDDSADDNYDGQD